MNRYLTKCILLFWGLSIFVSCEKDEISSLNNGIILYPIGTEVLVSGKIYDIRWNISYDDNVRIGLYNDTELVYNISEETENDGLFP